MQSPVLVLDNGAGDLKIGLATSNDEPLCAPNSVAQAKIGQKNYSYIANDIATCRNTGGLLYKRPFEKGYLTNWPLERQIWGHLFNSMKLEPSQLQLLLTEPPFNFQAIQTATLQEVFEAYRFQSLCLRSPASLVLQTLPKVPQAALVVDVGYSFSHVIPFFDNFTVNYAIRRMVSMYS